MTIAVPTLSASGWVRAPAEKADFLLSHFYESDKFQTYIYGTNVTNLQWLIQEYGHDLVRLCSEISRSVEAYLGRYYDQATAQCIALDAREGEPEGSSTLKLFCQVFENGKEYSIGRLIVATNSKFEKIMKLNNQAETS